MSNYSPGAEYDSKAPWKEEIDYISVKIKMEIETEIEMPMSGKYSKIDIDNAVHDILNYSKDLSDLSDWKINKINIYE